jgi:hypothetical protein
MMLTAFAVIVGGLVILADPIFQGLAISLLFGAIASLLISPLAVPLIYYMTHAGQVAKPAAPGSIGKDEKCIVAPPSPSQLPGGPTNSLRTPPAR